MLNHGPRGKERVRAPGPLATTFSLANQYMTLFSVCFCSKAPSLMGIVGVLALDDWPTALYLVV